MPLSFNKVLTTGSLSITNTLSAGQTQLLTRSLWTVGALTTNAATFGNSIDGNASTRWDTNASQAVGQTYAVNFNQVLRLDNLTIDTTNSANDYPTAVAASSSLDGTTWTPIGVISPMATITRYSLPSPTFARQLRLTLSTVRSTSFYWSIHEFNVSGSVALLGNVNISETGLPMSQIRLYLDASNPRSYSGTGRDWISVQDSTVSASFSQSREATYSNQIGVGGLFTFTQNQNARIGINGSLVGPPNNWSLLAWVNPGRSVSLPAESTSGTSAAASLNYILYPQQINIGNSSTDSGAGVAVATNGVVVGEHAPSYAPPTLVYSATINTWTHIAVVYENKVPKLYVNGTLVRTSTASTRTNILLSDIDAGPTVGIGGQPGGTFGGYAGDLAMFMTYGRALSATEVSRAYNLHRRRFGV